MATPKFTPHPACVPGDFYVEKDMCLCCGVPQAVAPNLVGWIDGDASHCYWKKQPTTSEEIDRAVAVLDAQELGCHRYAGNDPAILKRISPEYCDYFVSPRKLTPFQFRRNGPGIRFALLAEQTGLLSRTWTRLVRIAKRLTR